MVQSVVTYGAGIITLSILSHFMGLGAMICYSNVWFIAGMTHIINDAWYSATYKHINIACGLETEEGYLSAAEYIQTGMIGNFLLSIPCSIITVCFMPNIMQVIGYDESVVAISQGYSILVVLSKLLSSSSSILYSVLDIEGYAKFATVFDFWESISNIIAILIFTSAFRPSLVAFGIFQLSLDIGFTALFFYITFTRKGLYEDFEEGLFASVRLVSYSFLHSLIQ